MKLTRMREELKMVKIKERQWTWGRVRRLIIDDENYTLGSWYDFYKHYVPAPENNRTLINALDRYKMNYMLEVDGFDRLPELEFEGNPANAFCKGIFTTFVTKLKAIGVNIVSVDLLYKSINGGFISDEGALDWLEDNNFIDEVLGLVLTVQGSKNKRLYTKFNVEFNRKFHYKHIEMFGAYLGAMPWYITYPLEDSWSFASSLLTLLNEFDFDAYYKENFNENAKDRGVIYQELQEDIEDIKTKCEVMIENIKTELTDLEARVYGF